MCSRFAFLGILALVVNMAGPCRAGNDSGYEGFKVDLGCSMESTTFKDGWTGCDLLVAVDLHAKGITPANTANAQASRRK